MSIRNFEGNTAGETTVVEWQARQAVDAEALRVYLLERRRALITELRKLEDMLGIPQSVQPRGRPR